MSPRAAVILAAGQGTRMKSPIPKVLHRVGGRALIDHAIDLAQGLACERIVVVIGATVSVVRWGRTSSRVRTSTGRALSRCATWIGRIRRAQRAGR